MLVRQIEGAYDASEAMLLGTVIEQAVTDWRAAAWLAERRWPHKYGRRVEVNAEVSVNEQVTMRIVNWLTAMTPEELEVEERRLAAILSKTEAVPLLTGT